MEWVVSTAWCLGPSLGGGDFPEGSVAPLSGSCHWCQRRDPSAWASSPHGFSVHGCGRRCVGPGVCGRGMECPGNSEPYSALRSQLPWGARGGAWTPSLGHRMRNPGRDVPPDSGPPIRGLWGCCQLSTTADHARMNRPMGWRVIWGCIPALSRTPWGAGLPRLWIMSTSERLSRLAV